MVILLLYKDKKVDENGATVDDELKDSLIGYLVELFGLKAYVSGIVS